MPTFKSVTARELYSTLTAGHTLYPQQPSDSLGELVMHVSEGCNLACTYCFADRGQYGETSTKWMTASQARTYVESMAERYTAIKHVKFFGGEPLINAPAIKSAAETFNLLVENGSLASLPSYGAISNMTITNKTVIELINKLGLTITGSIDGPPEINDKFRVYSDGRGSWSAIDNGIKKLRAETGQPVSLEVVYGPSHIDLGYSMVDIHQYLADRYGIRAIVIHAMSAQDGVRDGYDWGAYHQDLRAITYEYSQWLVENFDGESQRYSVKFELEQMLASSRADTHCSLGVSTQTVTADGALYPCYTLIGRDEFVMLDDVTDLTAKDSYGRVQLRLIDNRKSTNPVCSQCDVMTTCSACPGANISVNGAIEVPDPGHCNSSIGRVEGLLDGLIDLRRDTRTWEKFTAVMKNTSLDDFQGQDVGLAATLQSVA